VVTFVGRLLLVQFDMIFKKTYRIMYSAFICRILSRISWKIWGILALKDGVNRLIHGSQNLPPAIAMVVSRVSCIDSGQPWLG